MGQEIEDFKNQVKDKHYEALSWETKFKMALEAKKMRDDELAKCSEIGIMKSEIHRMEVKYAHLKKVQEKMVQALENSVYHRDHIYDAANVREKKTGTNIKTQSNIKHKLNEMQNKLKIINSELVATQRQFKEFQMREKENREEILKSEQDIQNEKMQDCLLQTDIKQSVLLKQQNLENIVSRQKRAKRYKMLQMPALTYRRRNSYLTKKLNVKKEFTTVFGASWKVLPHTSLRSRELRCVFSAIALHCMSSNQS